MQTGKNLVALFRTYGDFLESLKDVADRIDVEIAQLYITGKEPKKVSNHVAPIRWPGAPTEVAVLQGLMQRLTAPSHWHTEWRAFVQSNESPIVRALYGRYQSVLMKLEQFMTTEWYSHDRDQPVDPDDED